MPESDEALTAVVALGLVLLLAIVVGLVSGEKGGNVRVGVKEVSWWLMWLGVLGWAGYFAYLCWMVWRMS